MTSGEIWPSSRQSTQKASSADRRRRIGGTSLQHRPGSRHQRAGGGGSGHLSSIDPEAAISGPEEEDRDISPASTRKLPSAGQGRRIGTSLQHRPGSRHQRAGGGGSRRHLSSRHPRSRRQRAGGTKTRQTKTAQGTPLPAETG